VLVIIIGLVLLVVAAVFGLDLSWKNHYTIRSPALFGQTLGIHNAAELSSSAPSPARSCSSASR
jgi:hypothetical protein